jgi:aspartate kinase
MYKVFKFGGASIKDVESIKTVGEILQSYKNDDLVVVFSAIGKVTNMLEVVVEQYVKQTAKANDALQKVKDFHTDIVGELFDENHAIYNEVNNLFVEIEWALEDEPNQDYGYDYDQIVSIGEFLSTKIMSAYLATIHFENNWFDVRDLIRTDNTYRNAKVDWETTTTFIKNKLKAKHCITQGFLGCTSENFTTTLGREGSDFTAAILAFSIDAEEVVIWKDVPGMMNADPKHFSDATLLDKISFDEAIELAYFGAKVIHPKTIQPLKQNGIPLYIKSFVRPSESGSKISEGIATSPKIPSYIVKENQILISISDTSLSFIVETHMSKIFSLLSKHSVRVNMMQNSAVSFSICVDNDAHKVPRLLEDLKNDFEVFFNDGLRLYTIRHYTSESVQSLVKNKDVILEQKSRNTLQIVAK